MVRSTQVPSSGSFVRRSRIRSSSWRVMASGQQSAPSSCRPAASGGAAASGPATVISTAPPARSSRAVTNPYLITSVVRDLGQRRQLDPVRPRAIGGAAFAPGELRGPRRYRIGPCRARHDLIDKTPLHGTAAADALGPGGEVVGDIAPDMPLVGDPGQPAGTWQHAEQGQLGQARPQRSGRRPA